MRYYVSIEKNVESFEAYRVMWNARGIDGFIFGNMTEGIEKAIRIEKSNNELYFIDIIADEVDYLPQLKILCNETIAPILVATYHFNEEEHLNVLNSGADFYAQLSKNPEKNIEGVISVINSINRRERKPKQPSSIIIYNNILISPVYNEVFVNNSKIKLSRKEFDILYFLMKNKDCVITHSDIIQKVWGNEYDKDDIDLLWRTVERLRSKLSEVSAGVDYIKTEHTRGYKFMS